LKLNNVNETCGCGTETGSGKEEKTAGLWRYLALILPGLIIWSVVYHFLAPLAIWLTYSLLGLTPQTHLGLGPGILHF
jgi:hypothetical protein